jgi:hypothetical protein
VRRLIALLTALAVTFSLASVPAGAAAVSARINDVRILSPGAATTQIEVAAEGIADITKVRAVVYAYLKGSPTTLSVDDFELVEGTVRDGVWRTKSAVTVDQGRWWVDVELTTTEDTHLWPQRVIIDNGLDTVLDDVELTPTTVDAENTAVVFRGRLMSRAADGTLSPVAGATLRLAASGGHEATAVTGADGRAEGTSDFVRSADATLSYGGAFLYRPSKSAEVRVTKQRLKTRLTMNLPEQLIVGDRVPVTGKLERQDRDGAWGPLAGKQLDLQFDPATDGDWRTIANPVTDANGDYSFQALITVAGAWNIDFANDPVNRPDDYYGYVSSNAGPATIRQVTHRTTITGFNAAPEPVGQGSTLRAYGNVLFTMADGTKVPGYGTVRLQFSTDGRTWQNKGTGAVSEGRFEIRVPAQRDGYWRAYVPDDDGYLVIPSVSNADHVDVKYRTWWTDFNASPEPVKKGATITVKGRLHRDKNGVQGPGPHAPVYVYFKRAGTTTYTQVATATTDSNGWFKKTFKASVDGTWMAVYKETSGYLKSTSQGDFVDVK